MIRRAWAGTLDHVGGLGVFSLFLFGALAAYMLWHGRAAYALAALAFWYVQARISREKYRKRNEAIATVNMLEADGAISEMHAAKLRSAIRND